MPAELSSRTVGESALALLRAPLSPSVEAVPAMLINDLANFGHDIFLILDDYHLIQNESIHTALLFLIEHQPGNLHIIVSTRVDPPWPLARFRARNQLTEVRAKDLRFTTEEAAAFLNQVMGLKLSAEGCSGSRNANGGLDRRFAIGCPLDARAQRHRRFHKGFYR